MIVTRYMFLFITCALGCANVRDLRKCGMDDCPDHYRSALALQFKVSVFQGDYPATERNVFCGTTRVLYMNWTLDPKFMESVGKVDLRNLRAANDLLVLYGRARNCPSGTKLQVMKDLLDGANVVSRFPYLKVYDLSNPKRERAYRANPGAPAFRVW